MNMQAYKIPFIVLFLMTMLTISFCSQANSEQNLSIKNKDKNMMTKEKTIDVNLKAGEIFVAFVPARKPNTDALFQAYLNDVFPIAMKHGGKPIASLAINKVAAGNLMATDFIGFSAWPNQSAAMAFHEEMPPEELDKLRRPIWSELKTFAFPIEKDYNFSLKENGIYEFILLWGSDNNLDKYAQQIKTHKGKIAFNMAVAIYEDLQEGKAPNRVALIEWSDMKSAEEFRTTQMVNLEKEEAFYSQLMMPPAESKEEGKN
jgi:hypothetical protein